MASVLGYWRKKDVDNSENQNLECAGTSASMMRTASESPDRTIDLSAVRGSECLDNFFVREMQIGFREAFEYGQSGRCGAITRLSKVNEMTRYLSPNYYAFRQNSEEPDITSIRSWLRNRRDPT
jgi:hypothetical protein